MATGLDGRPHAGNLQVRLEKYGKFASGKPRRGVLNSIVSAFGAVACVLPLIAAPAIDSTSMTFVSCSNRNRASIGYELSGAPAIVTLDVQTNTMADASGDWVSIGGEKVQSLSGDVNRIVRANGHHEIVWRAGDDWGREIKLTGGVIRAEVTAWATNAPPEWLVIGLQRQGDVRFYAASNFVPHGIGADLYKAEAILMRKIDAAGVVWRMGETKAQTDAATSNGDLREKYYVQDLAHNVMLTEDYYIGVYPVTVGQYANMCARRERGGYNQHIDAALRPFCPIDDASVAAIRGSSDTACRWPENGYEVSNDSALKGLRDKCLLPNIDLPTEEQWEFACRAGTRTSLNSGETYSAAHCETLGWISTNSKVDDGTGKMVASVHPVGLKRPNAFGLYDMHGNVMEATLSRYLDDVKMGGTNFVNTLVADYGYGGVTVDPGRHVAGSGVVKRGGSVNTSAGTARSGHRENGSYGYGGLAYGGFRLWHPALFR